MDEKPRIMPEFLELYTKLLSSETGSKVEFISMDEVSQTSPSWWTSIYWRGTYTLGDGRKSIISFQTSLGYPTTVDKVQVLKAPTDSTSSYETFSSFFLAMTTASEAGAPEAPEVHNTCNETSGI